MTETQEHVNHPQHYGGKDNPYEAIKVIEAWGLGFKLGNAVKYISRAGKKDAAKTIEDLEKALWYLDREIAVPDPKVNTTCPMEYDSVKVLEAWGLPFGLNCTLTFIAGRKLSDARSHLRVHIKMLKERASGA